MPERTEIVRETTCLDVFAMDHVVGHLQFDVDELSILVRASIIMYTIICVHIYNIYDTYFTVNSRNVESQEEKKEEVEDIELYQKFEKNLNNFK